MPELTSSDVAAWVRAAQAGSSDAFGLLHRRYVTLVHGILLSRFRPAIAEELTQECFLVAFRKLPQLREPSSFGSWIAAIARRIDADERLDAQSDTEQLVDSQQDPATSTEAAHILAVIRSLPDAYRETLVLRLVEGMSGLEIAKATDMTPESVRVNLHRGMKKLREALGLDIDSPQDVKVSG